MKKDLNEMAEKIRLLILDVDGVLTDGTIYYSSQDVEFKGFHVHDGLGIILAQQAGIEIAVISAKKSLAVSRRLHDLNIDHVYLGYPEKRPVYEDLKLKLGLTNDQVAYMGDDLLDLPILTQVGFAISVPSAPSYIRECAHLITEREPGKGAVREACEFILTAQGALEAMIASQLQRE